MLRTSATHRHFEVFRAVIATGSFTRAARQLGMSQPSVSRMMKELRETVGFNLFTRSGVYAAPTAEAIELHREIDRSFAGLERVLRRAADIRDQRVGMLRIVSMPALAHSFLPRVLADFLGSRPDVQASLQIQRSDTVPSWIGSQQFDLGFAMLPFDAQGVEIELFDPAEGMCVMPPNHSLAARERVTIDDLRRVPLVGHGPDGVVQRALERVFLAAGFRPNSRIETPLSAIACELVSRGLGVTIADPFTAATFVERGLVARPFEPAIRFDFGALYPTFAARSGLVDEFLVHARRARDALLGRGQA